MVKNLVLALLLIALAGLLIIRFDLLNLNRDASQAVVKQLSNTNPFEFRPDGKAGYDLSADLEAELITLLKANRFDQLDAKIELLSQQFDKSEISEISFEEIFAGFTIIDPSLEEPILAWVEHSNSWKANFAASLYFDSISWQWRGGSFWNRVPDHNKKKFRRYQKLAAKFGEASKQDNNRDSLWYSHQISLANQGSGADEKALITDAIAKFPSSILVHHAAIHAQSENWGGDEYFRQDLIHSYSEILDKDQHDGGATVNSYRAVDAAQNKDYIDAIRAMRKALELNPNRINYYYRIARYYYRTDQFEEALQAINVALEYWPNSRDAYLRRANIYLKLTQVDLAQADLEQLLSTSPYHKEANLKAFSAYARGGHKDKALAALERVGYFTKFNANEIVRQGFHAEHDLKDDAVAQEYYYKAIELNPLNVGAHYELATLYGRHENCKVVEHIYKYIQGCLQHEGNVRHWCKPEKKTWAKSAVNYLQGHQKCPEVNNYDFSDL